MSNPPPLPEGPGMGDEMSHCWARLAALEEIAERLAVTCVDPIAIADYDAWKAQK